MKRRRERSRRRGEKPIFSGISTRMRRSKASPARMVRAIKGSGGIVKNIAESLGVSTSVVNNRLNRVGEEWDFVRKKYEEEHERIADVAEETILELMQQRIDLNLAGQHARWLLERKFTKRGYQPKSTTTIEGGTNPLQVQHLGVVSVDTLNLPLNVRRELLQAIEESEGEKE